MFARSETSSTREASAPASMIRPTSPSGERTGMPTRTPSLAPADRIAKRRGLLNEEPTMRPTATVLALVLAQLERRLELPVLLEDRLGFDHPLKHRLALALQLGVLARGIPVIAGAGEHALRRSQSPRAARRRPGR